MLGRWDSVAINIAIVLGVGIFIIPSEVSKYLSSPGLIILAWLAGGVISLLGALCYAELSSSFPKTGGDYIYLKESYGPLSGFLFGWTELLVIRTGSIAAVSFILAEYLKSFLSLESDISVKPIAIAALIILSFINLAGLRYSKNIQNVSVIAKISAIAGIIIFGFFFKKGDLANFNSTPAVIEGGILPLFALALVPIMWTYGGWHENTFVAGETKDAGRALPFALIAGIFIITGIYLAMNFLYIYLIPSQKIAGVNLVASEALQILWGPGGKKIFEILVIISSLGCLNAMIMTGSRVTYAMAKDNAMFRFIGKLDAGNGSPSRAIIIDCAWAVVLIVLGTFSKLLFFTGIAVWLFLAFVAAGVFVLRRKFPDMERPYRAWGYPATPLLFVIVCAGLFVNTLSCYPFQSIVGLCLVATGIPIFILSQKKGE